jgi:twitching motility protein PilT
VIFKKDLETERIMAITQTPELERALQSAAAQKATDLYLLPGEPVTFRVADKIVRSQGDALSGAEIRAIAQASVGEARLAKGGTEFGSVVTSCSLPGVIDGQMCVASSRGEITIVIGLLTSQPLPIATARVPESIVKSAAARGGGLLIFTGRVGSGKTTTMLSVVEHLNVTCARHICTVERPVYLSFTPKESLITQREVGVDGPDALACISAAIQQDPDVLMVGEITSSEELQSCMSAARLGVLVITQLHAPTPEAAIGRLCDVQPPEQLAIFRRQLAEVLRGICAQVLMPRAGREGRVPAYGVLIPDATVRRAIAEGSDIAELQLPPGSRKISDDIENLRREGQVTDEVARAALDSLL